MSVWDLLDWIRSEMMKLWTVCTRSEAMTGWFLSMQARQQLGSSAVCARLDRTGLAQVGTGLFSEEEPGQDSFAAPFPLLLWNA